MEWFLSCLEDELTMQTVAQLFGCHRPFDPNQHPRVEYAKQYDVPNTARLKQTYGFDLDAFKKRYNLEPDNSPESTPPPDLTRPPKETFCPQNYAKMKIQSAQRPTWAIEPMKTHSQPKNLPITHTQKKEIFLCRRNCSDRARNFPWNDQ